MDSFGGKEEGRFIEEKRLNKFELKHMKIGGYQSAHFLVTSNSEATASA